MKGARILSIGYHCDS